MNILSAFLVALSLSMDNFAVALAGGCSHSNKLSANVVWQVGLLFALAHFVMFSLGFLGGYELLRWIGEVGTWVASALLIYIGLHMIWQSFADHSTSHKVLSSLKMQMVLALATSVDALLVGLGLGLKSVSYWLTVLILSGCVFATSICGFYAGHVLGRHFGRIVEIAGGCVLIFLAVKWLL